MKKKTRKYKERPHHYRHTNRISRRLALFILIIFALSITLPFIVR